jgi:hypothetical protein
VPAVTGSSRPGSNVPPVKQGALNSRQERCGRKVWNRAGQIRRSVSPFDMAVVANRVQVSSKKVGEAPRDGVVTGFTGSLLRVRWSTGEESTIVPSLGSLAVVSKQSGSGGRKRQTKSASAAKRRESR